MIAAWYETQGPAHAVLRVGEVPDPVAGNGEVRMRVHASGINPGETKKRSDDFGVGMPYDRVIPHSDGSGVVDQIGKGASGHWLGRRVWCFGAQSYRPFGTAAEYVVVPEENVCLMPEGVSFGQGACLGIPGITAHRAVHVAGSPAGKVILVQGGAGAVGSAAVALASHAGARVFATVRSEEQESVAVEAGAHGVVRTDNQTQVDIIAKVLNLAPAGVDHIVEVAFHANVQLDEQMLRLGGSIATYATRNPSPHIPFWPLVFKNISMYFLGSDDFPQSAKTQAAADLSEALAKGWGGYRIGEQYPLVDIADAHVSVEQKKSSGRVILRLD